jgi:hypothetical protein
MNALLPFCRFFTSRRLFIFVKVLSFLIILILLPASLMEGLQDCIVVIKFTYDYLPRYGYLLVEFVTSIQHSKLSLQFALRSLSANVRASLYPSLTWRYNRIMSLRLALTKITFLILSILFVLISIFTAAVIQVSTAG